MTAHEASKLRRGDRVVRRVGEQAHAGTVLYVVPGYVPVVVCDWQWGNGAVWQGGVSPGDLFRVDAVEWDPPSEFFEEYAKYCRCCTECGGLDGIPCSTAIAGGVCLGHCLCSDRDDDMHSNETEWETSNA